MKVYSSIPAMGARSLTMAWSDLVRLLSKPSLDAPIVPSEVVRALSRCELKDFKLGTYKSSGNPYPIACVAPTSSNDHTLIKGKLSDVEKIAPFNIELVEGPGWSCLRDTPPNLEPARPVDTTRRPIEILRDRFDKLNGTPIERSTSLIALRHARWERTHTYGPQYDWGDRIAFWLSPEMTREAKLGTTIKATSNSKYLNNPLHRVSKAHIDYEKEQPSDQWGDIDIRKSRLRLHIIGPRTGDTRGDVYGVLGPLKPFFNISWQPLAKGARLDSIPEPLSNAHKANCKEDPIDIVLVFRGGGKASAPNPDEGMPATPKIQECSRKLVNAGVEVVFGVGHGQTYQRRTTIFPDRQFGINEFTTPTQAAVWIAQNHVSLEIAASLGRQTRKLETDAGPFFKKLPPLCPPK